MSLNLEKHLHPKKVQKKQEKKFVEIKSDRDKQRWEIEKLMANPEKARKQDLFYRRKEQAPKPKEASDNWKTSVAGACSGQFHIYRHQRRREEKRMEYINSKHEEEVERATFEAKARAAEDAVQTKAAKNKKKRARAKMRKMKGRLQEKIDKEKQQQQQQDGDGKSQEKETSDGDSDAASDTKSETEGEGNEVTNHTTKAHASDGDGVGNPCKKAKEATTDA